MGFPTKRCRLVYRYCTYCELEIGQATYEDGDEGIYIREKKMIFRRRSKYKTFTSGDSCCCLGSSRDGAKSFDVTDILQKIVDDGTGDSLVISAKKFKPLDLFGDLFRRVSS